MSSSTRQPASGRGEDDASERTPLLSSGAETESPTLVGTEDGASPSEGSASSPSRLKRLFGYFARRSEPSAEPSKPLPKLQLFLLCYARMTEPVAFFSIFPFIAPMVQRNGHLPDADIGFYSGLIESLFSVTQMFVLLGWSRLADRIGRRPTLVGTLAATAVTPVLFGLARTLPQMILFRCLAGVFSGSSLVIRTMISEHSTPETQARAFSWFAFAGNLGIFLGPLMGGVLADPAEQYPGTFKGIPFFEKYPYALPGFVTGLISASGAVACALFLEETLPKESAPAAGNGQPSQDDDNDATAAAAPKSLSTWELLKAPSVGIVLWVYGHAMFLAFAFTAIVPVVLYTPVALGGTGFSSFQISIYMAVNGASQALWLLLVFPPLHARIGTRGIMKLCGFVYPFFFAGYIVLSTLLRDGSDAAVAFFWVLCFFVAVIGPGVSMAFTGVQLAINDVSPDVHALGSLNAIALAGSSGIRAILPAAATSLYAIGVRGQILGGHLAWVVLIPIAAAFGVACRYLPEGKRAKPRQVTEEEAS